MNHDRIINLLASGLKPAQVATIVGCSPARLSQLAQEEDFKLALAAKTEELSKSDIEEISLNAKYHAAEVALINQVLNIAPMSELRDATAALRVIGERQDKRKLIVNPVPVGDRVILNQVIQLNLPNHATPELFLSSSKEVLAINDKQLTPMSSEGVTSLFKSLNTKETNHELRRIPQETERVTSKAVEEVDSNQLQLELLQA